MRVSPGGHDVASAPVRPEPATPTRTTGDEPTISIIVPVYNDAEPLRECLTALLPWLSERCEIIVVDDASTDDIGAAVRETGVKLLRLQERRGPAAARNHGARHATGDVLFFVDSDVVVAPHAIARGVRQLSERPELAAVFGSYDASPRAKGLISQYRNLLHHYVHQTGDAEAATFWAGCGAVKREIFETVGGFDEQRTEALEDIELGYRLCKAGYRILLDREMQATHLKRWTLGSLIHTDVTARAIPWARLLLQERAASHTLNLEPGQRLCVFLVCSAVLTLCLALLRPEFLAASIASLAVVGAKNRHLYAFFAAKHGILFAFGCLSLHFLYYFYSGLSYLYVWTSVQTRRTAPLARWGVPSDRPSVARRRCEHPRERSRTG